MPLRIEDYALIGDCHTGALVGRDGSIDWLCLPRFDSGACFAALLGTPRNGRWLIAPENEIRRARRQYRPGTLVLDTEFQTDSGRIRLTDCMRPRTDLPVMARLVEGLAGEVPMNMELVIRFDYGSIVPWVRRVDGGIHAIAGPDTLQLRTSAPLRGENLTTQSEFTLKPGQRMGFVLAWHPSHRPPPELPEVEESIDFTQKWWAEWSSYCRECQDWHEGVLRSLITLKALSYAPTGGIVAAPTTSLPEQIGGVRNWDYRYCWVRDATFTLLTLLAAGFQDEARAWREWLLRAVAGSPSELQIMYGIAGERRLTELTLEWLAGYENSAPVRIGNAASRQFQLDVYGELLDAMYQWRHAGLESDDNAWNLELALLRFLEKAWKEPDEGIWEVRGGRRHFTHSKVMAWVAIDRAIRSVERFGLVGPDAEWRRIRQEIHEEICRHGFNAEMNSFVQSYDSKLLDASLLMLPMVGFLPADDPRVRGTVAAIEKYLVHDGFVQRYTTGSGVDGLPAGEGAFLPCTFWLADNYYLQGRHRESRELFERLLDLRNDVGLLSEEYDPVHKRLVGNFPQAFSHIALAATAHNLSPQAGPVDHRSKR
jgi:GH15 family glucan-1,4-alpha-glucosidase